MASVLTGLRELEESVREWIESLDPAAYVPALAPAAVWHASDTPGDLLDDGRQLGALLYDVRIEEGDWRERLTSPASQGGCAGSIDVHDATIVVQFSYPCRAVGSDRREDWSAAGDAAEHVLRGLCSPPYRYRRSTPPERVMAAAVGGVGSWIVVTVRVLAEVWFHLDPPEAGPTPVLPANYVIPVIMGDRGADETLTAWPGLYTGTTPITFAYSWWLDGVAISGATGSTYVDPDGEGLITVRVVPTNAAGSAAYSESQPLGSGGGPVDCATNCAAEIAAATAAGVATGTAAGLVTGNAEGRAARELEWRNPGLFSSTPTEFDPSGIGVWSAPDANGDYTVTMSTGTAASLPSTGSSKIWPLVSANGQAIAAVELFGVLRFGLTTTPASSSPLRGWCVVMDTSDPTTARGWGAYYAILAGGTNVLAGVVYTTAPGTWVAASSAGSNAGGQLWVEAVTSLIRSNTARRVSAAKRNFDGTPQNGSNDNQHVASNAYSSVADYSSGAWLCLGLGSNTTGLAAGDYVVRGQSGLVALAAADAVGVGLTP